MYCHASNHWPDECRKFATADGRYKQLNNRCANCLNEGHSKRECRSKKPCYYCKSVGSHHSSLCFNQFGRRRVEGGHVAGEKTEILDTTGSSVSDNTVLLASGEAVLLQTALVPVASDKGTTGHFQQIRPLLDPGANRTYCSEGLARQLGLKVKRGPSLTVNRFGSSDPMPLKTVRIPARVGITPDSKPYDLSKRVGPDPE